MPFEYPYLTPAEAEVFIKTQGVDIRLGATQGNFQESQIIAITETHAGYIVNRLIAIGYIYPFAPKDTEQTEIAAPTKSVIKLFVGNSVATNFLQRLASGDRTMKTSGPTAMLEKMFTDLTAGLIYLDLAYRRGTLAQKMFEAGQAPKWSTKYKFDPTSLWDYVYQTGGFAGFDGYSYGS